MIVLYQTAWSPYCLVIRRILEAHGLKFRAVEASAGDRSAIWKLTRERYYQVPVLKEGREVVFEVGPDSQVIAKYLDSRHSLSLFPREWEGIQNLLWRYFENDVEGIGFRLNDIHWREFVPQADQCAFVRHKERKFGRGCLEAWRQEEGSLLEQLQAALDPAERMLGTRDYLLTGRPLFVDFCLWGMLANVQFTGRYPLPEACPRLRLWYDRVKSLKLPPHHA